MNARTALRLAYFDARCVPPQDHGERVVVVVCHGSCRRTWLLRRANLIRKIRVCGDGIPPNNRRSFG